MPAYLTDDQKKVTTTRLRAMKAEGRQVAMLTSYDYTTARIVDAAGVDAILIGDSAGNVMAGYDTTLPVTLDEMIYHARSVVRGVRRACVVCDLPFGSYQVSTEDALRNTIRLMKETGVDGVKLEGGSEVLPTVRALIAAGIPVCGHLGLTPQSVHRFGGYGVRAREKAEADQLLADAKALDEAGCFAIVLEKIPAELTRRVVEAVAAPVIGIGAGQADGQVLVIDDMLGKNDGFRPKFLRLYANLAEVMTDAVGQYVADVKERRFPNETEHY